MESRKSSRSRWLVILLTVMLVLSGCSRTSDGGTSDVDTDEADGAEVWTVSIGYGKEEPKELSADDQTVLSDMLSAGSWENDLTKCEGDCVIAASDGSVYYYHSKCGTFNDNVNRRFLTLEEEQRILLNDILRQYGDLEE